MKKLILHCFLGKLCPFPNRSRSISRSFVSYLSDIGAVFRQPQADIFQERSDFISQAKGLPISNFLYQKWFLQTCLILSILSSSINEVSSQVADSPGTDLLHRSMPHRSGFLRSEPFFSITALDIDGGLGFEVSVQSQLVGNEILNQTAALPLGAPRTCPDYFGSDVNESAVDCRLSTEDYNKKGFSLVDTSLSPRQEGAIPSARIGNGYIYGEIVFRVPLDTVYLNATSHYLDENQKNPLPHSSQSELRRGNLFEGSFGKQVFEFSFPIEDSLSIFSLRIDGFPILEDYLISAGDSLKILIDLRGGQVLFAGPSGPKYQAQHSIYQSLEASRQDQQTVMVSSPSGREKMISRYPEMYEKAQEEASSLRKSLRFISNRADSLYLLESLALENPFTHPAWSLLESQRNQLGKQFTGIISSRIIGRQLLPFFRSARSYANLAGQLRELIQSQRNFLLEAKERFGWNSDAPELIEILLLERYLMAVQEGTNLFHQYDQLEQPIRDRLYGKYLASNIEHRAISPEAFAHAEENVKTPWILDMIREMQDHLVAGADLSGYTFLGEEGSSVKVDRFKGKLVLLSFWLSGCVYSQNEFDKVLHPAELHFKNDPRVVFLSVSADPRRETWQETLKTGDFTSELSLPVYAGPDHAMIQDMGIHSYPRKVLLDREGRLLAFQDLPRDAASLIKILEESLESNPQTKTRTK
ncbi:TlpA family protein disulfide reductase [Algoriphagus pacificus]|uniref:TlpA family protein disulfide reductase n=1 Tax=Algoriphagus pacificus TaxID=2811234 RepID=A0ABS3CGU8_9BACT|nr:TlpA disulfide reductase family protein [Algoriphagus pacificus]MBN7816257.1 TlpA family protein disulfide reductase [Algoriphagus pacificus]